MAVNWDWRWIYYLTSIIGVVAWVLLIMFVPETRRVRTKAELGKCNRPRRIP